MSESLAESVSSRLEKRKQEKLLNEQNLSNEIESRLNDGLGVFNNGLNSITTHLQNSVETLSLNLINQAQMMADNRIKSANQHLTESTNKLAQTQQDLMSLMAQISQVGVQVEQQITGLKQTLLDSKSQSQTVIADYAQSLQQQAQASMQQSEKQYQTFYQTLSQKQADMRAKALMVGLVTFFLAMLPTAGMLGMTGYSRHLMNEQNQALEQVQQAVKSEEQNLAMIMTKVQQTPIEARVLSMVTVLPNDQNPSQLLIIPKNQQVGGYGQNPKGQKVLLVAPETVGSNSEKPRP